MLACLPVVQKEARSADVIYAFGFDMALLGRLVSVRHRRQLIYELGDVHTVQLSDRFAGRLVRKLERWVLSDTSRVVVTAPGFSGYFDLYHRSANVQTVVLENKLLLPSDERPRPELHDGKRPIVIGYFGVLRCAKSWAALRSLVARSNGRVKVMARGVPMEIPVVEDAGKIAGLEYGGPYTSPGDLPAMYASVDLVWGCNSSSRGSAQNWTWARTNRFYESSYFRKPIVVLKGGGDGREVEAWGNGVGIDLQDPEVAAAELLQAIPEHLRAWQESARSVPDHVCITGNEHDSLMSELTRSVDAVPKYGNKGRR
jgi:succinoglycan biosynthesis protein ExoL